MRAYKHPNFLIQVVIYNINLEVFSSQVIGVVIGTMQEDEFFSVEE
jgi:hypothetical protein